MAAIIGWAGDVVKLQLKYKMTLLNVARWSALAGGVVYGFVHNHTLASEAAEHREEAALKKKEQLIAEAKKEWLKLHPKPVSTDGPTADFDSPDFDAAKLIDWKLKQEA